MASSTSTLLSPPDDPLAAIRQKNKRLIIIFFLLILSVAAVTAAIVVYLIHDLNQKNTSTPVAGIRAFCTFSNAKSSCINFLSQTIQARPESTPTDILRLSLQSAVDEVSNFRQLIPPSDSDSFPNPRFRSIVRNCTVWIRQSEAELGNATALLWVDLDESTRAALITAVNATRDGVGECRQAIEIYLLEASNAEAGKLHPPWAAVERVEKLLYYNVVFIKNMEAVNYNYYARLEKGLRGALDDLGAVILYGVVYAVLVFLFCLLMRIA